MRGVGRTSAGELPQPADVGSRDDDARARVKRGVRRSQYVGRVYDVCEAKYQTILQ